MVSGSRLAPAVLLAVILALPLPASAHPLHTTLTEISEDRARGTVRATIRVFADDFGTAVAGSVKGRIRPGSPEWDAAAFAYVSGAFHLSDRAGRRLVLRSCGTRRTSDLLWICLEGTSTDTLSLLHVRNGVLCELFDDQINVVQGTVAGTRRSILFTRGDAAKPFSR